MADEQDPNAGTPGADAAGSGEPAGTAEGAGGSGDGAEKKVEITSHEYVTLKTSRENEKALLEENARLKAERAAGGQPPTTVSSETDEARKQVDARRSYIARLRAEADGGNEAAAALVAVHEETLATEQRMVYRLEMSDVPAAEREDVKKFMESNGLRSPALARQFMRGGQYDGVALEVARLKEENAKLKANRPAPESTRILGEPPPVVTKKESDIEEVSATEYVERMNDPKRMAATLAARRANKLVIKR